MQRYSSTLIEEVRRLRTLGKTYGEIRQALEQKIPKSTLFEWCKNVHLPQGYSERIAKLNTTNLNKARVIANEIYKIKREEFMLEIKKKNVPISQVINTPDVAKIALAMLCLGEASKSTGKSSFYLGNSDPRIIILFLELLKRCYIFDSEKIRCTVQCRADQNVEALERYWINVTNIPRRQFYKSRIDPRTQGKPTKKVDYKGVLRVDYFDNNVRHDLESLASLIYNQFI